MTLKDFIENNREKVQRMHEASQKTGFETGLTICEVENEKYSTIVSLGRKGNVDEPRCELGEKVSSLHTHEKSMPSSRDLKKSVIEDRELCVLIDDVQARQEKLVKDKDGMILCVEPTSKASEPSAEKAFRGKNEGGGEMIKAGDIERLNQEGFKTHIENL